MNKQRKPKHYFVRRWLDHVLIRCRSVRGFLQHLRTYGHMNSRYTSLDDNIMLDIETFLRIVINLAMVMNKKDFNNFWMELRNMIYEFADEYGDEFNKAYEIKKTEH